MLSKMHILLDEADVVIHYNGKRHDIPHLNRGFIELGLMPPSPYRQIDLLETVKRQFKFPSNKLEYVVDALGIGKKFKNSGFDLWLGCMRGDRDSWKEMKKYNIQDVLILESLYNKILPWIKQHPNYNVVNETEKLCPTCGGKHIQMRGKAHTNAGIYTRMQCQKCGTWFKGTSNLRPKQHERQTSSY
jgi:ribosomal protein L34E